MAYFKFDMVALHILTNLRYIHLNPGLFQAYFNACLLFSAIQKSCHAPMTSSVIAPIGETAVVLLSVKFYYLSKTHIIGGSRLTSEGC